MLPELSPSEPSCSRTSDSRTPVSSEVVENSLGRPSQSSFVSPWFFCRPSDSAADRTEMLASCSRTEWAPWNCLSTACVNGELMGLQVPASDEELEDTASSKLQVDRAAAAAAIVSSPLTGTGTDCRQKRRVVDILAGLVPHSEVGENSPGMPSHFSDGIARDWFFSNLCDLATVCSSSEWGPRKCQSTACPNGEPEPRPKPPRRISEAPSARNLKPRHVSAVRQWPSGCGRVPTPSCLPQRVPLDVRQWVPGCRPFPPPKRRHVSAVRRYPPGCGRFPPSPPPTPSH
ncbi:hypothetical protein FCM35_KLT19049 [Carex littledalei]|uniref:Uncharacterized protein n=1 Tax=Carex littledalei TaxID=544730 RepID=A0A833VV38_9POAL|nr:hypothetical protein FCM35_KLT19049 [Carex littledalei]